VWESGEKEQAAHDYRKSGAEKRFEQELIANVLRPCAEGAAEGEFGFPFADFGLIEGLEKQGDPQGGGEAESAEVAAQFAESGLNLKAFFLMVD
jgi:hypothetical protein